MTVHSPYAVSVNGTMFSAIQRQSVTPESTVVLETRAGSPYPKSVTINAQRNTATATTEDIAVALGALGSEGAKIVAESGVKFFQLKLDDETGLPVSAAEHRALHIVRGKVVPTRLSCEHQGDASLEFVAHALWNPSSPTTDPLQVLSAQALPTGLAGGDRWTIAKVKVAGVDLDCTLSLTIEFGVAITTEGCNSDIYDRSLRSSEIKPRIQIRGKDLAAFLSSAIPLSGKRATHATTEIWLRKRLQGSAGFDATTTSTHIKITADGAAHWTSVHDADGNNRVESQLQIDCIHDGTNVPIVIATGQAMESE